MITDQTHRGSQPEPENNLLQTVTHDLFGQLRVLNEDPEPLFHAADVATALGYQNTRKAIIDHCKKRVMKRYSTGSRYYDAVFIPESDVFRLIMRSKLPEAETFQVWVFEDVLPAIRKTGGYNIQKAEMTEDEIVHQAVVILHRKIWAAEHKIRELEPKAGFFDAVIDSPDLLTITEVAKSLGIKSGQELNKWLHSKRIIYKQGKIWLPYSRFSQLGYFKIVTQPKQIDGKSRAFQQTKVTQAGKEFIFRLWNQSSHLLQPPNSEN